MPALRDVLRTVWYGLVVAVACVIFGFPVFLGAPFGLAERALERTLPPWCRFWFRSGGIRTRVVGLDRLARAGGRPGILIGNHQSALDIPLLVLAVGGRVKFLAKRSLFWIPVYGWAIWLAGFIPVDRGNARKTRSALERALAQIARGRHYFVVFPEGTRSRTGELLPYKRGSFNFAKRTNAPVIPFAIHNTGRSLPKGSFTPRPGEVVVALGDPILPGEVAALSADELLGRCRAFTERARADLLGPSGS